MYLEKRAREKEIEDQEKAEREKEEAKKLGVDPAAQAMAAAKAKQAAAEEASVAKSKKKKKGGFFGSRKKDDEDEDDTQKEINEADLYRSPRPAFYAHTRPTKRTQVPRDVAVPYFRFRKERFYDWPPDPTVSRATPLMAAGLEHRGDLGGSVHVGRRERHREEEFEDDEYYDDEDEFEE